MSELTCAATINLLHNSQLNLFQFINRTNDIHHRTIVICVERMWRDIKPIVVPFPMMMPERPSSAASHTLYTFTIMYEACNFAIFDFIIYRIAARPEAAAAPASISSSHHACGSIEIEH